MSVPSLPAPVLEACSLGSIHIITDNALAQSMGVRVAFTGKSGGVSKKPYESLNLGSHVGDKLEDVHRNRELILAALKAPDVTLIVPNQLHGTNLVEVKSSEASEIERARVQASSQEGADGVLVAIKNLAALLCFADCAPVALVSPTGNFALVHAGWRGALAGIASKALRSLSAFDIEAGAFCCEEDAAKEYNVYVGPHIHAECFETGSDVCERFVETFGPRCAPDACHVDLLQAIKTDLIRAGASEQRMVDAGVCTVCASEQFFSYRASGGVCGRHGALALRL